MEKISNIVPQALFFTVAMGIWLLVSVRKNAVIPLLCVACYITFGQRLVILGLDFTMLRILVIFGWLRVILKGETRDFQWTSVDTALIFWVLSSVVVYSLLWQTSSALINRLGHAYDAVGLYYLLRVLISGDDSFRVVRVLSILLLPLAFAMLWESMSGQNPFYLLGGVPQFSEIRNGRVRCQGSFAHAILAGTFGATTFPLCLSLWWDKDRGKVLAFLGVLGCTIITATANSSGPASTYILVIVGWCFWRLRERMRMVRWALAGVLVLLHMLMKAPVWYLYARLADVLGGSGWHRSELIDQTIGHFNEWWLMGTRRTIHWMDAPNPSNPDMVDITNWFVGQAVNGGMLTLILFVLVIVRAFQILGLKLRSSLVQDSFQEKFVWGLGVSLFAHILSFTSVAYFDQIVFFWFLLLAMTACLRSNPESAQ